MYPHNLSLVIPVCAAGTVVQMICVKQFYRAVRPHTAVYEALVALWLFALLQWISIVTNFNIQVLGYVDSRCKNHDPKREGGTRGFVDMHLTSIAAILPYMCIANRVEYSLRRHAH